MHKVKEADYLEAVDSDMGWCVECKEFTTGMVEPDAREYDCDDCGQPTVYGAEQALMEGLITF